MTYTQAEVDAFRQAIVDSKGALTISYGDQTVTFASLKERAEFLAHMERNLVTAPTSRSRYAATSKGV